MSITTHSQATNRVLLALSAKENQRLRARSEQVDLVYGDALCEPGKPIRHVYFPNNAIISSLTPVDGHENVGVGLIGREGMAGMELFLGINVSSVLMLVHGSGTATRMRAASFRDELKRNPVLRRELNHYLYAYMAQVAQTTACNHHHLLGKRLARWLLMMHDRVQSNEFHLTQESLGHMLGVRRVGVSGAARVLQEKKLIGYCRGHIAILDRKGLERASCRCYGAVKDIRDRMLG
jgi:CRP-like cAMP-binding protein